MHIAPGTRIGSYEVVESLGAGGMGRVFRAADTRLGRDVALKVLSDELAQNVEALERLEREARFLAALSHPNIATIFGIEQHNGEHLLVLELVSGVTLAERIERGRLRVDEALRIAVEIAAGLEAAHEAGIIHRDLKPANVKITPAGRVKILDFGIAKNTASATANISQESTLAALTGAGMVVGTPLYMSPEQLGGGEVDRRADIWAFGCIVFEMLCGRRPFANGSLPILVDAVRHDEPQWDALPAGAPARIRQLIERCLRKDQRQRLGDIAGARLDLQEALKELEKGHERRPLRPLLAWLAAALAVMVVAVTLMARRERPSSGAIDAVAFPKLTQLTFAAGVEEFPAWSPDGRQIVYAAPAGGVRKLFVVGALDGADQRQLTSGPHDDVHPAWSNDASTIFFTRAREPQKRLEPGDVFGQYDSGDIWAVDVTSRQEWRVAEQAYSPAPSPDGRMLALDASWAGLRRIWIVDARGRNPQQLTNDRSEAAIHTQPRWSPDAKRLVYQHQERTRFDVRLVDWATRESRPITSDLHLDINPAWGPNADTIYFSSNRGGGINVWSMPARGGPPVQLTTGAGQDVQIAVSGTGRLAYVTLRQNADLWRLAMGSHGMPAGEPQPLVSTTREDSRGAWSPDGRVIAFNSDRTGDMNIWLRELGEGRERQLTRGAGGDYQPRWSADGKRVVFFSSRSGNADIWTVDVATGRLTQVTTGPGLDINPTFSPDGRSIAYASDHDGRTEVWVVNADGAANRQRTQTGVSGHFLSWRDDGFIYYRCPCGGAPMLMRVAPGGGAAEDVEPLAQSTGAHISFSPDGTRFIDVVGHKSVWLYARGESPQKIFEFSEADARIDFPLWSPDGEWLLFDRYKPEGGDIWVTEEARD